LVNNTNLETNIEKKMCELKDKLSQGDYQLYELDLLQGVSKRIASFSSDCKNCRRFQDGISSLVSYFDDSPKVTFEKEASYGKTFRSIIKHLEENHKLCRNRYQALWFFIPVMVGIGLFALLMSLESEFGSDAMGLIPFYLLLAVFTPLMFIMGIFKIIHDIWFREKL